MVNDNEESRRTIEHCYRRMKTAVNPIIDWTDAEVWEFIKSENIPYCGLYDCGYSRLGCIGCPMAQQKGRERDFARYPKYKAAYLRAFGKMLKELERRGKKSFCGEAEATAEDVYNWWMEYDILPGQIDMFSPDDAEAMP